MAGDSAYLQRLLHRVDFPVLYSETEDREVQMQAFVNDLYRVTNELTQVKGIGRVEGMRQVFHVEGEGHRFLVRGSLQIRELDFTPEAEGAILDLLENGFVYHVGRKTWIAEGIL